MLLDFVILSFGEESRYVLHSSRILHYVQDDGESIDFSITISFHISKNIILID